MSARSILVATNVPRLEQVAHPGIAVERLPVPLPTGLMGARRLLGQYRHADVLLLDGEPELLARLCLVRWLWPRWIAGGPRLWSVDLVLNTPTGLRDRVKAFGKRLLLSRVEHFVHYFHDLSGYDRYFGIGAARSTFLPFKVNGWHLVENDREANPDGDYVFTSGVSLRDYDTFMKAMAKADLPGRLVYQKKELCQENGTPFPPPFIAPKVQLEVDDGSLQSWVTAIRNARLVVIPIFPQAIRAAGISLALMAMALGKCVVITEGVTTRGVFNGEVVLAPPGDAEALAGLLRRAWDDADFRRRHGQAARQFAEQVGEEKELNRRFVELLLKHAR